jgi:hypothetical protein
LEFCSNIPIKDVVGGIGVVSKAWSELSLDELTLLTEGDLAMKLAGLRSSADDRLFPVGFGLTDADLEAARVAAMNEGDFD